MERFAVAELIPTITPSSLAPALKAVWTGATDTLMVDLAGQLTAVYLTPFGLTLSYEAGPGRTRVFSIQIDGAKGKGSAEAYPARVWAFPPVPQSNVAHIVRKMSELMHVQTVCTEAEATAVTPSCEVLSVTIPTFYPQSGSDMVIASPTGEKVKINVPSGSLPGSQVFLVMLRT